MEYSQNIIDQANKAIANGSKLSFDEICAHYQKKENGKSKRDKRSMKKVIARREAAKNETTDSFPMYVNGVAYYNLSDYNAANNRAIYNKR
jgi:hypothetical protein